MFGKQSEILAYLEHCTDKYGVRPHVRTRTEVVAARFDVSSGCWTLTLANGETIHARTVVSASGGLSRPALPDIPGVEDFHGTMFHSARWDHTVDLKEKRVAVIGTGASAIQIVPEVAKHARKVHLFQRTPPWVLPKPDREIGPLEQKLYAQFPGLQKLYRRAIYWLLESRAIGFTLSPQLMRLFQAFGKRFIERTIDDPALRQTLIPDYTIGCKRILISNDYYPALNQPHVDVIAGGAAALSADGVTGADGRAYDVDVVIMCTGFQAAEQVAPFPVLGLDDMDLNDAWQDGAEAYLGTTVSGFPNFFMIVGPNTGLGHSSMVFMIESQINHIMACLDTLWRENAGYINVRNDVQSAFNRRLQARLQRTVWASGCQSWYQTSSGKITTLWPGFTFEFWARTRRLRKQDYQLAPATETTPAPNIAARAAGA